MLPRTVALNSQQALQHNLELLARRAGVPLLLPVKANAYGHGLEQIARFAVQLPCVWGLGVATPREALRALQALGNEAPSKPILLFTPPDPSELSTLVNLGVHVPLTDASELAALPSQARVHLKVDTGMNRLGVKPNEAVQLGRELAQRGMLAGVYSHFSSADDADASHSHEQYQRFAEVLQALYPELRQTGAHIHLSNGAAVLNYGRWLSQLRPPVSFARPGLASYGYGSAEHDELLLPVMTVQARINAIRTVPAGESISYGRLWTAPRDTKVAVLGMGYADGLPRNVTGKGSVMVGGVRCPILGRVCMDQCIIDITQVQHVSVGDWATVWGQGQGSPTARHIAQWADLSVYEVLTGVGERVERQLQ